MKKPKSRPIRVQPHACPCGSQQSYQECCGAIHDGQRSAADPTELVRARFSAFARGRADYLFRTLHSAHDDRRLEEQDYLSQVQRSMQQVQYRAVQILDREGPDAHGSARVLFLAQAQQLRRDVSFVEQADFALEDGEWRYLQGDVRPMSNLTHAPSDMRLDHWQCDHYHHH